MRNEMREGIGAACKKSLMVKNKMPEFVCHSLNAAPGQPT
jgi:hypothetical protein